MYRDNIISFDSLVGKTIQKIEILNHNGTVRITTDDGEYLMEHDQDCCECVEVQDADSYDFESVCGTPVLLAEETTLDAIPGRPDKGEVYDSGTWTFYKIETVKGSLNIRWLGESNGYYSERVDFRKVG